MPLEHYREEHGLDSDTLLGTEEEAEKESVAQAAAPDEPET